MNFCPNCGKPVNENAKFCGSCGKSLLYKEVKENEISSDSKLDLGRDQVTQSLKNISERVATPKQGKRPSATIKKILPLVGIVLAIAVVSFGVQRFSNKDYREAYSNGEYLFEEGKYGDAMQYFDQAHQLDPKNEDAIEMFDYSKELAKVWTAINADTFDGSSQELYESVKSKAENLKNKEVKAAYENAATGIENTSSYQIEDRIGKKYQKEFENSIKE